MFPVFKNAYTNSGTADRGIEQGDELVIVTTKGEAVGLALALMAFGAMVTTDHGAVCRVKRVIMDRDVYPRQWGRGKHALKKKSMVATGRLNKYGRPNENTPAEWFNNYKYLNGDKMAMLPPVLAANPESAIAPRVETHVATPKQDSDAVAGQDASKNQLTSNGEPAMSAKKRKRVDETPEERAERKKKQKAAVKTAKENKGEDNTAQPLTQEGKDLDKKKDKKALKPEKEALEKEQED